MSISDEQLLNSCLKYNENGDNEIVYNEEMSMLISRYTRIITIKAHKMKCDCIEFDDLVSEGFLGFLDAMRNYSPEKGAFCSFANVCIANKMINAFNKAKKNPPLSDDFDLTKVEDESAGTEDMVILKEENREFFSAMNKILTKRELEVLGLYLNSFSYQQISRTLGIEVKSVDNALSRARTKLRKSGIFGD